MQFGEGISAQSLKDEYKAKCPFNQDEPGGPEAESENIADDDKNSVQRAQKNDGGVLGNNLSSGSKGKADGGPYPPSDYIVREKPYDTKRDARNPRIHLPEYRDAKEGDFPIVVAAHHLIPGNASLKKTKKLVNAMKKDGNVKSRKGRNYTIKYHIGYDINGAHNGVWLPGNYAIKTSLPERKNKGGKTLPARIGTTPVEGLPWSKLSAKHEEWQFRYVAGSCKVVGAQFHDTHVNYSEEVQNNYKKFVWHYRSI